MIALLHFCGLIGLTGRMKRLGRRLHAGLLSLMGCSFGLPPIMRPDWDPDHPWHFAFYIDGATNGAHPSWAVVAVVAQGQAEWFFGCLAAEIQTNATRQDWLGASNNDNIAAELTAMVVAQFVGRWLGTRAFVDSRPDLHLSMRLAHHPSVCKKHTPLAQLVQLQSHWAPHTAVFPIPGHSDNPWNDLADSLAKHALHRDGPIGHVDPSGLHQLVDSPHDLHWAALQTAPLAWQHCLPTICFNTNGGSSILAICICPRCLSSRPSTLS
eukprot:Skav203841  [mRNA]  locus=scaffold5703:11657:12460:- [translate_table: standard]